LPLANGALALDVRRPCFKAHKVLLGQLQFGRVLDGDHALALRDIARQDVEQRGFARAGAAGDQDREPRSRRALQHVHHFRGDAFQFDQLIGLHGAGAEAANRHGRPIQRERRNDGIYARAVGQARIHHGGRFIHAPTHTRHDTVDDLQQMAVVAKHSVCPLKFPAAFNKHIVFAVHQDVGDARIAQQRFQRPKAENLVEQVGLDFGLLFETQGHALCADNIADKIGDHLSRLARLHARQLLQIQF